MVKIDYSGLQVKLPNQLPASGTDVAVKSYSDNRSALSPFIITAAAPGSVQNGAIEYDGSSLCFSFNGIRLVLSSGAKGYFGGGGSTYTAYLDIYTFSNDNITQGTNLGTARRGLAGCNSATTGYFGGGQWGDLPVFSYRVDKYTFSSGSLAQGTDLKYTESYLASFNSSTDGYWGLGSNGGSTNYISRYWFSNDACLEVGNGSLRARDNFVGCNSTSNGYFSGGTSNEYFPPGGNLFNWVDVYNFSNTQITQGTNLLISRYNMGACNSSTMGYYGGGTNGPNININVTDKYTFSGGAVAQGNSLLFSNSIGIAACNSSTIGYFAGGGSGGYYSASDVISKYTFSDNTVAGVAILGLVRGLLAACNSGNV